MTLQGIIKHLKILERAELIRRLRNGRETVCTLNPVPLESASAFIRYYTDFWNHNLTALSAYLESESGERCE